MPYDVVAYEADDLAMQLSEAEEGLFHRMLRRAWMNGSIPSDMVELSRICRTHFKRLKSAWPKLSKLWVPHESLPGRLINLKQERERDYRVKIREQNRLAGIESAKVRQIKKVASTHAEQPLNARSTSLPSPSLPLPNTEEKTNTKDSHTHTKKEPFGEHGNVRLTTAEFTKLVEAFGEPGAKERILSADLYFGSKGLGAKYKSHYLTILNWDRKNGNGGNGHVRTESPEEAKSRRTREASERILARIDKQTRGSLPG